MSSNYFESGEALESYLWAHYATDEMLHALHPEARKMGRSLTNFVVEPLRIITPEFRHRALDLGCAMGRTTFELRRYFNEVVGLDGSQSFINAAETIRCNRQITMMLKETRPEDGPICFQLPAQLQTDHVSFKVGDACNLQSNLGTFDLVMLTQLIDRVANPARCLKQLQGFVTPGGWLVISTTSSWWEKYTPREEWLSEVSASIIPKSTALLVPFFDLQHSFHLPYFIRERSRGYEWSIAEISLWKRSFC